MQGVVVDECAKRNSVAALQVAWQISTIFGAREGLAMRLRHSFHRASAWVALLALGWILLILPKSALAFACDEDLSYSIYPTHRKVEAICANEAEARQACYTFVESHGYGREYCTGAYGAGWLRDGDYRYYGSFGWEAKAKPETNAGAPECPGQCFGDPINAGNGNKFESKVEYRGEGLFPLEFSWTYNFIVPGVILPEDAYVLGGNRSFNYGSRVARMEWGSKPTVYVSRPDGKLIGFTKPGSDSGWVSAPHMNSRLTELSTGWEFEDEDGQRELFDATGRLVEIRSTAGHKQYLSYGADGKLAFVRDMLGRQLAFSYNPDGLIGQLTLPDGRLIKLSYTSERRLTKVEYQDGSSVQYLYNESGYVTTNNSGAMTGVVDESNVRTSSTTYNHLHATGTSLAAGAEAYTATYTISNNRTYVTYAAVGLPSGASRQLNLTAVHGRIVPRKIVTTCNGCSSRQVEYAYDSNGRYDVVNDNGVATDYDYDSRGRALQIVEAANDASGHRRTTQTDWHGNFRVPVERRVFDASSALVAKMLWSYNARGQVLSETSVDPAGLAAPRVTTYGYCEQSDIAAGTCPLLGLPISQDGPRTDVADVVRYVYYASDDAACAATPSTCAYRKGDLWKVENALGQTALEVRRYDGAGRALSVRNANGVATDYEFNLRGWLTAAKTRGGDDTGEADDQIVRVDYWPTGLVKKVTLPDGAYAAYTYDAARRLTDVADEAGNSIHYTLDSRGNRTAQDIKAANGAVTHTFSRVYNLLDEVQAIKDASQHATAFTYDSRGNPDLTTDALGRTTDQDHDPLDRLVRTLQDVNGLAVETKLQYDANDRLTRVVDPKGLSTSYGYNGLGDQIRLTSPDTGVTTYGYNAAGQLTSKQDANDATAHSYTYDALGRPKAVSYGSGGNDVEYDYDTVDAACAPGETYAVGQLVAMRTEGTELKYCYDRFGRLVRKLQTVDGKAFVLRYAYDKAGRLQALTYPDGAVADYARDAGGRIAQVHVTPAGGARTALLTGASYRPFGPVTGWTYGNGRSLSRSYDLDYRAKTIHDNAAGGLSLGYGYNEVGELTELKDGLQSGFLAKYDYDSLGRLKTTRDGPTGTPLETYGYDATGNRTSLLRAGATTAYTYPADSHRLTEVGGVARDYDAVGNTTRIGGTAKEFVYNANDRMSQVKAAGAVVRSYRYNARGERVAATHGANGPVAVYTLYDEAGHWIGDYDANGAAQQQAVWLGDAPVGVLAGAGSAQKLHYVQPDHLGTPRAVIDADRNVAIWSWNAKGEAFGNDAPNQDPDQDGTAFVFDMRFPGQRFDAATGLNYNYFRDYDAKVGRFIQRDPIDLKGGINRFEYAVSSPIAMYDPLGLMAEVNWFQDNPDAAVPTTFFNSANSYDSPQGTFTIATHGIIGRKEIRGPENQPLNAQQVWDRIKDRYRRGGYRKIRIAACEAGVPDAQGKSFLSELARISGQDVEGTRYWVGYPLDGKIYIGVPLPGVLPPKAVRLPDARWEQYPGGRGR